MGEDPLGFLGKTINASQGIPPIVMWLRKEPLPPLPVVWISAGRNLAGKTCADARSK